MKTYKMLSTQKGVKAGEVHPSTFHEGKHYAIDDDLAEQFATLGAVEESHHKEVAVAVPEDRENLHENWLDTDPAVMRHGELTPEEIVQKDESPLTDGVESDEDHAEDDGKPEGDAKAKKAKKSEK